MSFVGCDKYVDTGYTQEEWDALDEDEKLEAENEAVWDCVTVSVDN